MFKINFLYLSGILLFVIYSCNSSNQELTFEPPHFKDTVKVEGRIVNDTFIMGRGNDIDFHNDILMVATHKGDEGAVHFFNIPNGTPIKSILPKGRGPGEAMIVMDLDVNHQTGDVAFYDLSLHKLNCFNIDSVVKNEQYKNYIASKPYLYMYAVYHGKDSYIAKGGLKSKDNEQSRFSIIDNDSVIFRYCTFPKVTVPNVPNGIDISYVNYCYTSVSPQKSKLVCASGYGAILEIFDINKNSIDLETIKGFYKPVFDIDKNQFINSIPNKTINGFIDLYVTDNYIYTLFNDIPYNGVTKLPCKQIAVFDWEGNEVCLYQCNYNLEKICVNEQTNKLYAIGLNENHETVLVEFNLNR